MNRMIKYDLDLMTSATCVWVFKSNIDLTWKFDEEILKTDKVIANVKLFVTDQWADGWMKKVCPMFHLFFERPTPNVDDIQPRNDRVKVIFLKVMLCNDCQI